MQTEYDKKNQFFLSSNFRTHCAKSQSGNIVILKDLSGSPTIHKSMSGNPVVLKDLSGNPVIMQL